MDRARRAGFTALVGILAIAAALAGSAASARAPGVRMPVELAADVGWPVTTGLAIAEVVTGGASASDEWIELTNVGGVSLDLAGLEVAYVTSSGATVTRKATWTDTLVLEPGRHLLLANASGIHAAVGDLTYSGGLAATGGALVLRPVGGTPIDALGWGDAVNAFVEGTAAPAPAAGSSLERRPGGLLGHATDSNDNVSDFAVNPLPIAQNLGSPPTPGTSPSATPTPSPTASPSPSATPEASPSPTPTSTPDPSPSPSPSPTPEPSPSPSPTPEPSPSPSPVPSAEASPSPSPSPSATALPSPSPSPSPTPSATAIEVVRALPDGASATIEGILATALGMLDGGRGGFVQDPTGGIALYLDGVPAAPLPAGTLIRVAGTVDDRYGQRTLRIAWADLSVVGTGDIPMPVSRSTGSAGEADEGRRLAVSGVIVESPSGLADGLGLSVDDGSGPLRVIVGPDALGALTLARGDRVSAIGSLGQRDSSGTGATGYRLFATLAGEVAIVADPSPSPPASVAPSLSPSPTPWPTPTPSGEPSASPSPSANPSASPEPSGPTVVSIATARTLPLASVATVRGVVTAEPGRLGKPPLIALDDGTAAIVVHLPDGVLFGRGDRIEATGRLAAPYGQSEIRPEVGAVRRLGRATLPEPLPVMAAELGESLEARLLALDATVVATPRRATSGDLTVDIEDAEGVAARVMVDGSTGMTREAFVKGRRYTFIGIEGQRATRVGALDGYRIWLRGPADLRSAAASPSPSPSPSVSPGTEASASPSPSSEPSGDPAVLSISGALATSDTVVGIEATVTAGPMLLDATGRRIVVQDPTGAVEVLMPDARQMTVGDRIRATGIAGTAYGAPRFRAQALAVIGHGSAPSPVDLRRSPDASLEWRLARVRGLVVDVHRMGERWSAELQVGGERVLVTGLAGSGIDAGRMPEGATATVVGIVRRPYPTASDRRFALVPRSIGDVAVVASPSSAAGSGQGAVPSAGGPRRPGAAGDVSADAGEGTHAGGADAPMLIDLARIGEFRGAIVRVGGLIVETGPDGVLLDDGTARAWLALAGPAASLLPDLTVGDAVSATATVAGDEGEEHLLVEDPAALVVAATLVGASATPAGAMPEAGALGDPGGSDETAAGQKTPEPIAVAIALLGVVAIVALAVALRGRRWLDRRRVAARIAARLAALGRATPGASGPANVAPAVLSVAEVRSTHGAERPGPS